MTIKRLSAQKESQEALVSRSKDLLGVGLIAGTIASAGANTQILSASRVPVWWIVGILIALAADVGGALLAMRPRFMTFTVSPADLRDQIANPDNAKMLPDQWYESLADAFLRPKKHNVNRHGRRVEESDIDFNQNQNTVLARIVRVQIGSLALIVAFAVLLLFVL